MGEGDRPWLLQLFHELGEHESERHTGRVQIVIAERIVDIDLIPQVEDGVASQLRQLLVIRRLADDPFEPELGREVPVWLEIVRDLAVDRAYSCTCSSDSLPFVWFTTQISITRLLYRREPRRRAASRADIVARFKGGPVIRARRVRLAGCFARASSWVRSRGCITSWNVNSSPTSCIACGSSRSAT